MDAATRNVFEKLCAHVKTNGTDATMSRAELQKAAGLSEEDFMAVLRGLRGPNKDQDMSVRFVDGNWDKIALGIRWAQDCGVK